MFIKKKDFQHLEHEVQVQADSGIANDKLSQALLSAHLASTQNAAKQAWEVSRTFRNRVQIANKRLERVPSWIPIRLLGAYRRWRESSANYQLNKKMIDDMEAHAASWKMHGDVIHNMSQPLVSGLLKVGEKQLKDSGFDGASNKLGKIIKLIDPQAKGDDNDNNKHVNTATSESQ